jgi:pimeloyl-ACP methyl ester carboxylesterase
VSEQPPAHVEELGSGPPLLLLHGWGSSAELMKPIATALAKKHRCVAVDFPGHGSTAEPPVAWGSDEFVAWTVAVMDRLEIERADIIGHSHGGRVAIGLAAAHPQRVGKLVLAASAGLRGRAGVKARARVRLFKSGRYLAGSRAVPGGIKQSLQSWVDRQGSDDYRAASGVMRATLVKLVNGDARQLLPKLQCPTLLIWGDRDDQTPLANAREMEQLIPDAGLVVLGGGGHFVYAEQLDRFCRVVENFLAAS